MDAANTQLRVWRAPWSCEGWIKVLSAGICVSGYFNQLPALRALSTSVFFQLSVKCILILKFKKHQKKESDHFYFSFLIKTLKEFQPICTKLSEKVEKFGLVSCLAGRSSTKMTFCKRKCLACELVSVPALGYIYMAFLYICIFFLCVCGDIWIYFIWIYFVCLSIITHAYNLVLSLFYICIFIFIYI